MNEIVPKMKQYDAFLSHNSKEKSIVEEIARKLEDEKKLIVFLDKWNLVPGDPWQEALELALDQSRTCVVFLGPGEIGPWQNEEMRSAIDYRVSGRGLRVVPVLLPGALRPDKESLLPAFLRRLTWVSFSSLRDQDALHRLYCGVIGQPPGRCVGVEPVVEREGICPFRGLEIFREQDAPFFFGRENVVQQLVNYLEKRHFLALIGPSGSGKSSIVQAGLIPELKKAFFSYDGKSKGSRLRPLTGLFTPKSQPVDELALACFHINKSLAISTTTEQIVQRLRQNKSALHYLARELTSDDNPLSLYLIVDQFEELFTQTGDEIERRCFIDLLLYAMDHQDLPLWIILTMRSDFIGKCTAYPDLNTFIQENLIQVGPMSALDLRRAIEEPASATGLNFDNGLVDQMIQDATGAPGELPLLEHALYELYQRREGRKMTLAGYREIGGIEGALAKRAEEEFAKLNLRQQDILQRILVERLVQPGEGTEDTRRRAGRDELYAAGGDVQLTELVLQNWTNARLLTTLRDETKNQDWVDVAHEALIRKWPRIQQWLAQQRESTRQIGNLHHAAQEWQRGHQNPDFLYHGTQLARAEELLNTHANLTEIEKEFIVMGITQRDAVKQELEKQRQMEIDNARNLARAKASANRWLKVFLGAGALAIIVITILAFFSWRQTQKTREQLATNYYKEGVAAVQQQSTLKAVHYYSKAEGYFHDSKYRINCLFQINYYLKPQFLMSILQHERSVNGAIFNRDESRILSWSVDGTARLWNARDGTAIGQPMKHEKGVNGAIFNRDESRILSWSVDGTARLWNARDGTAIGQPMKHEEEVNGAIFNRDESRILSWSVDGTARLWNARDGMAIGQPMKHEEEVNGAIFNRDESRILSWSYDGTTRLWNARDGTAIGQPMKHESWVVGAIFNRDGSRILSWSADGTARLWNARDGMAIGQPMKHEKIVNGAIFNRDGTRILSWSSDGTARLWNARDGTAVGQPMKHEKIVNGAIFNRDESRILTWGRDGIVRLWDVEYDQDFPPEHSVLLIEVLTGTKMDDFGNVTNLKGKEWFEKRKAFLRIAKEHYKKCKYRNYCFYPKMVGLESKDD